MSNTSKLISDVHARRDRFTALEPLENKYLAEYIWMGGGQLDYRSKTRVIDGNTPAEPDHLPEWNFDGSSTGQAEGKDSEVLIKPRAVFRDPFRCGRNVLVLCDCYKPDGQPLPGNTRAIAADLLGRKSELKPWFGFEQEYVLLDPATNWPYGWPNQAFLGPQGPYYCGVGAGSAIGRDVADAHLAACLYAGIQCTGLNLEVLPSQLEFQVCAEGIAAADQMHAARYILLRIGEEFGVRAGFDPKPLKDWNGSGLHTNYSTVATRAEGGYQVILEYIAKLGKRHFDHIAVYGEGNDRRLSGLHETAPIDKFSFGVANRGASIRIPRSTEKANRGYLEDRRPAANGDPYIISSMIFRTTCLE